MSPNGCSKTCLAKFCTLANGTKDQDLRFGLAVEELALRPKRSHVLKNMCYLSLVSFQECITAFECVLPLRGTVLGRLPFIFSLT